MPGLCQGMGVIMIYFIVIGIFVLTNPDAVKLYETECPALYQFIVVFVSVNALRLLQALCLLCCWSGRHYVAFMVTGIFLSFFMWIYTIVMSSYFFSNDYQRKFAQKPNMYYTPNILFHIIIWTNYFAGTCMVCILCCAMCIVGTFLTIARAQFEQENDGFERVDSNPVSSMFIP